MTRSTWHVIASQCDHIYFCVAVWLKWHVMWPLLGLKVVCCNSDILCLRNIFEFGKRYYWQSRILRFSFASIPPQSLISYFYGCRESVRNGFVTLFVFFLSEPLSLVTFRNSPNVHTPASSHSIKWLSQKRRTSFGETPRSSYRFTPKKGKRKWVLKKKRRSQA